MAESDEQAPKEKLSRAEAIAKLREIQVGFRALVYSLHENIAALDDDPDFQESRQAFEEDAEQKAKSLESEVRRLRSDVKTFKDLLGDDKNDKGEKPAKP
jgi:DNA-binding transcriptional MerR regulator